MKTIKKINYVLNFLGGLLLLSMMLVASFNIIFRLFGHPIKGTFELLGFLGAMVCSLSLAETEAKGGHIQVALLYEKMPKKIKSILDVVTLILSIGFWSLVCFKLFQLGLLIKDSGELSETLRIPFYPVIFLCLIGVLALIVFIFLRFWKKIYAYFFSSAY
ncbi:TRAP transporter small permease [Desulfothermus okinawensis]